MKRADRRTARRQRPPTKRARVDDLSTPNPQESEFSDPEASNDSQLSVPDSEYDDELDDDLDEQEEDESRVMARIKQGQTSSSATPTVVTPRDEFSGKDLRSILTLRPDHPSRPLWVGPDGHIFLETFGPISNQAQDFLIAIAEPVCRPEHIHEYKLTSYSLYAAVSVGLRTNEIIGCLRRLCKTQLPAGIIAYIRSCTMSYGKAKLVLKGGRFFVESTYRGFLKKLASDPVVKQCLIKNPTENDAEGDEFAFHTFDATSNVPIPLGIDSSGAGGKGGDSNAAASGISDILKLYAALEAEAEEQEEAELELANIANQAVSGVDLRSLL